MKKSTSLFLSVLAVALCAVVSFAVWRSVASRNSSRGELLGVLLHDMPGNSSAVLYVDVVQLRQSTFAQKLFAWAPQPSADADYTRFVQDAGFNYERDLDRVAFAAAKSGSQSLWFVIADGAFDRKKIVAYLAKIAVVQKRGGRDIYSISTGLPAAVPGNSANASSTSHISLAFL